MVAPPACRVVSSAFLKRHQWRGMDFAPGLTPSKLTEQYNVTYIGIGSTGVGHGVYENGKRSFLPSRSLSTQPTLKRPGTRAYDIISHRRLEFDAGHTRHCAVIYGNPSRNHRQWQTAQPAKPAAAKKPATPIWPGQRCTHCLTELLGRASPPIPAILRRFFDGKKEENRTAATNQIQHKNQTSAEAFSFFGVILFLFWDR